MFKSIKAVVKVNKLLEFDLGISSRYTRKLPTKSSVLDEVRRGFLTPEEGALTIFNAVLKQLGYYEIQNVANHQDDVIIHARKAVERWEVEGKLYHLEDPVISV